MGPYFPLRLGGFGSLGNLRGGACFMGRSRLPLSIDFQNGMVQEPDSFCATIITSFVPWFSYRSNRFLLPHKYTLIMETREIGSSQDCGMRTTVIEYVYQDLV
jgi:hypothetical protein